MESPLTSLSLSIDIPYSQDLRILSLLRQYNLLEAKVVDFQCCCGSGYNVLRLAPSYLQAVQTFVLEASNLIAFVRNYLACLPGCENNPAKEETTGIAEDKCQCFDELQPRMRELAHFVNAFFDFYRSAFRVDYGFSWSGSSVETLEEDQADCRRMMERRSEVMMKHVILFRHAVRRCQRNHLVQSDLSLLNVKGCRSCCPSSSPTSAYQPFESAV